MAENLGASFTIDITQLKSGLKTANTLIKESESAYKKAAAEMDNAAQKQELLEEKAKSLNKIEELQKEKVKALKENYQKLVDEGLDEASSRASQLRTQINKEEEALAKTRKEIKKNTDELDKLGSESDETGDELKDLKTDTDKSTGGFTVMKGVLANLVSSAIKNAIQGFKDLAKYAVDAYKAVDEGSDNVIKATGATGTEAEALKDSYKNVSKSFKGDFSEIGSVLGEVNTRFGYTGDKLEETTKQFLRFANITGTDAKSAVQDVSKALEAAGLDNKDYSKLLDMMAKASQKSGVSVDKLTDGLTKNGSTFRAMGLNTEDTIAILAQFEKSGVNTETALAGMKTAAKNWATQGKDSRVEFQKAINEIAASPNRTAAAQTAMEIFGKKAGTELGEAIQSGRFNYSDFIKEIESSKGTVENTYEATQDSFDKLDITIQNVKTDMAEWIGKIMDEYGPALKEGFETIGSVISGVIEFVFTLVETVGEGLGAIVVFFEDAWDGIKAIWGVVKDWFQNLWNGIKSVFSAVGSFFSGIFQGAWNGIKAIWSVVKGWFQGIWNGIKAVFSAVGSFFANVFRGAWNGIKAIWNGAKGFFKGIWDGIKAVFSVVGNVLGGFFSGAWDKIKGVFSAVGSFFASVWDSIKAPFIKVATWFEGIFSDAWRFIKNCFSAVGSFFSKLWGYIKTPFVNAANWFGEKFKKVVEAIKKPFKKLKEWAKGIWDGIKSVFSGVTSVKTSELEAKIEAQTGQKVKLATGGVVRRATNAIIGEAGAEAVVPLENNTDWIDKLASMLESKMGGGGTNIVFNQTNNSPKALSRWDIYRQTKNLLNASKGV